MLKLFIIAAVSLILVSFHMSPSWRPAFDRAHGAFVCNYTSTICRDRSSVLPVAWRRYAEVVKWEYAK